MVCQARFERFLSGLPGSRSQTHVHNFATEKLRRDFRVLGGNGATPKTTARPFGQRDQNVHFQDFRDRGGDGASLQTEAETVRPRLYRRIRCTVLFSGPHGLTDKASDFKSDNWGFESLCGRLFSIKSCAGFKRFF